MNVCGSVLTETLSCSCNDRAVLVSPVNDDVGLFVSFAVINNFLFSARVYVRRDYVSNGISTKTIKIVLRAILAHNFENYFIGKFESLFKWDMFGNHRVRNQAFSSN